MKFEREDESQTVRVRLVSGSMRAGDPVRVTVAGVEVEGRGGYLGFFGSGAKWSMIVGSFL